MLTPSAMISALTPAATDGGGRGSSLVMIVNSPCLLAEVRSCRRMENVAEHMNSASFGTGGGLASLAKQLRPRCEELIRVAGERLPK